MRIISIIVYMDRKKTKAQVLSQGILAEGIMDLRLLTDFEGEVCPGQFVGVYTRSEARLLPRPISICEAQKKENGLVLRLVYRIAGQGTAEFALLGEGAHVDLIGILGNGFPVDVTAGPSDEGLPGKALVVGGGIGIPPLLGLTRALTENGTKVTAVLGYRDSSLFLANEFRQAGAEVVISTEDASAGIKGNVVDAMRENDLTADVLYSCGPLPMLKGVKAFASENGIKAYISLEERMACGVGACLACVCRTEHEDPHSHVCNARICADGPVFAAEEVVL